MKNHYSKSSFHKLYLIEKEMYDRILPYINEVDKQEINDLNEEHRPEYEDADTTIVEKTESKEELNVSDNDDQSEDLNEIRTEISHEVPREAARESLREASQLTTTSQEYLHPSIAEEKFTSRKGIKHKKYACNICVNKSFTTRSSLNRHRKTFHIVQPLNKAVEIEIKPKDLTSNEGTEPKHTVSKLSTSVKRQREDDEFSNYSDEKSARYGDLDYELENTPAKRGLKRKGPKRATDLEPRKKFRWESFDGNETNSNTDRAYEANSPTLNRGLKRKDPTRVTDFEPRKKFRWEAY